MCINAVHIQILNRDAAWFPLRNLMDDLIGVIHANMMQFLYLQYIL